jgi:hypothetical protein
VNSGTGTSSEWGTGLISDGRLGPRISPG